MRCDNCRATDDLAFTLAAYPTDGEEPVFVDFCSSECLEAWTSGDGGTPDSGEWDREEEREPSARLVAD